MNESKKKNLSKASASVAAVVVVDRNDRIQTELFACSQSAFFSFEKER